MHRSDSSGDTFLFSSFLTASDPSGWTIPPGTTVAWPNVPGAVAAMGNGGMVQACKANPGLHRLHRGQLPEPGHRGRARDTRQLKNKSGNYELPTPGHHQCGGGELRQLHAGQRGGLDDLRAGCTTGTRSSTTSTPSCPTKQPSALAAQATKAVLAWAIDPSGGNASTYLAQVNFVALPSAVVSISAKLIAKVTS